MDQVLQINRKIENIAALVIAIVACLFLFYIDEGNYSLKGLSHPGNIFAMSLYLAGLLLGQVIISSLFFKRYSRLDRILFSGFFGLIIGFFISLLLIFCIGLLFHLSYIL